MKQPYGWNVCVPRETTQGAWQVEQELALLKPDRWMDWHYQPLADAPNFTPMVWGPPLDVAAIQARMLAYPGECWMLMNEPENDWQARLNPAQAVDLTRQFLRAGWDVDAEFNWCAPNCAVNMYPDDEAWPKEYMRLLRLGGINRPSVYGIHGYHSTDRRMVQVLWRKVEQWRGSKGWMGQDAPIVITEACAENEPYAAQVEVMDELFVLLKRGAVKGVYWFSTHAAGVSVWPNACLTEFDPNTPNTVRLTALGKHWVALKNTVD